jgi:hypothetical protein
MSLTNYTDLLSSVANWIKRPDLAANIPDFVALCEQRITYGASPESPFPSQPLRIRAMETDAALVLGAVQAAATVTGTANAIAVTLATTPSSYSNGMTISLAPVTTNTGPVTINVASLGAQAVVKGSAQSALVAGDLIQGATYTCYCDGVQFVLLPGSAHVPLPSGYLAGRDIYIDTDPRDYLDYIVPDEMNRLYPLSTTLRPRAYTIEADAIRFAPAPDQTYYCRFLFYKKFSALATASTNWLMTNAPGVYLYGTLLEAAPFIANDERIPVWAGLYRAACDGLQRQDERDRHSGSQLTMRTQHRNP